MDVRRLYKSDTDKMICGVCGGIGEFLKCGPNAGAAFMGDPDLHRAGAHCLYHRSDHYSRPSGLKNGWNIYGDRGRSMPSGPCFFQRPQRAFPGQGFFHGLRRVLKRICARPSRRHTGPEGFCISFPFLGILF